MMLTESAAAATFGLINSFGQLGGLAGLPHRVFSMFEALAYGWLWVDRSFLCRAAALLLCLKIQKSLDVSQRFRIILKNS